MTPSIMTIWVGSFFAMVVIGLITLFVLSIFFSGSMAAGGSGIFTNNTYSANATLKATTGLYLFFDQLPNVGRLAGVALIIGVLGLMGVGGYMGYRRIRGL